MRDTGIIRRMDDLGRLVVPKRVRESLGINSEECPPFQIYTEVKDGKNK